MVLPHRFATSAIETAQFVDRPNRFLVRCRDRRGGLIRAYLPNPGRLRELLLPGATLTITESPAGPRETPYTVLAVQRDGVPVLLHTHLSNAVAEHLLRQRRIPGLEHATLVRSEVPVGRSRFDFLLQERGRALYLEIKSCTLFGNGVAMFRTAPIMAKPIVTLTSDFGAHGPYVAELKGVLLGMNADLQLVDVSHEIAAQNVREAAFLLYQVVPHFPPGSIHLAVVDPGVGTARRLLAAQIGGHRFLAPDNGLLSWVPRRLGATGDYVSLSNARFWRDAVSSTFHGRDILAPVAAWLSRGATLDQLGEPVPNPVQCTWPEPVCQPRLVRGEVLFCDRFGNLITNIPPGLWPAGLEAAVSVRCAGRSWTGLVGTYGEVAVGSPAALVGSAGLLELACRESNAARTWQADVGTAVELAW
jgi:hypothetical protein